MNDDWAERLRKRLENYEVEPPPGLWEAICERLGIDPEPAPEPVPAKKPAQMKRWIWAAAAGILALVGVFVAYQWGGDEAVAEAEKVSKEPISSQIQEKTAVEKVSSYQMVAVHSHKQSQKNQGKRTLIQTLPQNQVISSPDSVEAENSGLDRSLADKSCDSLCQHHESANVISELYPEPTSVQTMKKSSDAGKWSVGLMASGGLLAANNSVSSDKLYYRYSTESGYGVVYEGIDKSNLINYNFLPTYTLTEYVARHRLPLRFGLSLHYQFHPRLALLSGISYTRLYSEFSLPLYRNISYSQRLHYIGVPLGVAWQLWRANRFSVYLTGGAMVEKCVSVSLEGDYKGDKPWQWSVNAAVGTEYTFTSLLGAYIEPSLGYYFSDGTQLEHYYKEHPLAPSIEFGLRMHIGR
jgi:hypothetical protein